MKRTAIIGLLLLLTACVKTVFEQHHKIDDRAWRYSDSKPFSVQIDKDGLYDISVSVQNTDEYLWNNLWVNMEIRKPGGITEKDRYNFKLADIAGRWLGRGPGKLHDHSFLVKKNMRLPLGLYTFILQHDMRENYVSGIADVGMQVVKVK